MAHNRPPPRTQQHCTMSQGVTRNAEIHGAGTPALPVKPCCDLFLCMCNTSSSDSSDSDSDTPIQPTTTYFVENARHGAGRLSKGRKRIVMVISSDSDSSDSDTPIQRDKPPPQKKYRKSTSPPPVPPPAAPPAAVVLPEEERAAFCHVLKEMMERGVDFKKGFEKGALATDVFEKILGDQLYPQSANDESSDDESSDDESDEEPILFNHMAKKTQVTQADVKKVIDAAPDEADRWRIIWTHPKTKRKHCGIPIDASDAHKAKIVLYSGTVLGVFYEHCSITPPALCPED